MLKAIQIGVSRLLLLSLLLAGSYANATLLTAEECPMAAVMDHHDASRVDSGCLSGTEGLACDDCPLHSLILMTGALVELAPYSSSVIATPYLPSRYNYLARLELPPPRPHLG